MHSEKSARIATDDNNKDGWPKLILDVVVKLDVNLLKKLSI